MKTKAIAKLVMLVFATSIGVILMITAQSMCANCVRKKAEDTTVNGHLLASGSGQCKIEFTFVPSLGSSANLQGRIVCENPNICSNSNYAVAVYIYVPDGWWTKPYWAQPLTSIRSDCTWTCDVTTGGIRDPWAVKIIAFLVPNGYDPEKGDGQPCLGSELYQYPYAGAIRYKQISFAGYDWRVKRSCDFNSSDRVGPGPNYFSDSEEDVWVDPNGLHLKITKREGKVFCSEVIADVTPGYGTYIFTVQGRAGLLDENIVLGLFTWEDCLAEYNYGEIDVEVSRWGDPFELNNAQYVVQPWHHVGNRHRFHVDEQKTVTYVFIWDTDEIFFFSYYGDFVLVPQKEDLIDCWSYTGSDIPPHGAENPRINFWLVWGDPPSNGQDSEIVIKNFKYLSDTSYPVDWPDFLVFAEHWLETNCDTCGGADLDRNGHVNCGDFSKLAAYWLQGSCDDL